MKAIRRIVLILLMICIVSNSMIIYAFEELVGLATDKRWDNSLHFMINHLHSTKIKEEQNVVIEGYIVPNQAGYEFYIVNQDNRRKRENNRTFQNRYRLYR